PRAAVAASAARLAKVSTVPQAVHPQFADNGHAAIVAVPVSSKAVSDDPGTVADRLRSAARDGLPSDLTAQLSGPVGFQADIVGAFAGADVRLLIVTALVVAVLLLVTYRSPILWIVPLLVVGAADGVARQLVSVLGDLVHVTVDASVSGIQSVLVFGAGTNYALLIVSRYREELLREPDRFVALRRALRH
ncbi:MMPL family transporter, partial [Mesorhizobium japonicum]|uniref:MMPL family transporter n=1 Tax=Mesorhizobium japonicum TaxID=2066070 RepID=UPI003B59EC4D